MGKLIVIEGLDGSGKATQSELLSTAFSLTGTSCKKVSFPNYASPSSALVKMYLGGEFGDNPSDVNAYAASTFYAVDRYAGYKKEWEDFYIKGGVVVADRYTTSNAVHQCSKLKKIEWDQYLDWLFSFEYNQIGIPTPDIVIFLDVPPAVGQMLMTKRYSGDETKKDIHEKDVEYLKKSYEAAKYCANKFGWKCIDCTDGENMLSISEISEKVKEFVLS